MLTYQWYELTKLKPPMCGHYLVWAGDGYCRCYVSWWGVHRSKEYTFEPGLPFTHWMPLPGSPAAECGGADANSTQQSKAGTSQV